MTFESVIHWTIMGFAAWFTLAVVTAPIAICLIKRAEAAHPRHRNAVPGLEWTDDPDFCRDKALSFMGDAYRGHK